jgi:hypothetical protein
MGWDCSLTVVGTITSASGGRFVRQDSVFRNWVTTDGTPGPRRKVALRQEQRDNPNLRGKPVAVAIPRAGVVAAAIRRKSANGDNISAAVARTDGYISRRAIPSGSTVPSGSDG